MNRRDRISLIVAFLIVVMAVRCVSRTMLDHRFAESRALHADVPAITVPDSEHFSFAIMGDTHIVRGAGRLARALADAAAEGDQFFILLGDITDQGTREAFQSVQDAVNASAFVGRVLYVIGNHDVFADGWNLYLEFFGPNHYSTVIGNSRFIAVDSADAAVGESQSRWLADELGKGGVKNRFVLSHYMPVVPGISTHLQLSNETEAARLMGLLSARGATAWLGAHYHSYVTGRIENVDYVVAGGDGRRMPPTFDHFFAQVKVDGSNVTYKKCVIP